MTEHRRLTLRQLADLTGLTYEALWSAASLGEFPTVRLTPRGRYYARLHDVEAWLASRTTPAARSRPKPDAVKLTPPMTLDDVLPAPRRFA